MEDHFAPHCKVREKVYIHVGSRRECTKQRCVPVSPCVLIVLFSKQTDWPRDLMLDNFLTFNIL
jgi:hypothetical protein